MIDQKQLENVEYFNYLENMIEDYATCTREMKCRKCHRKGSIQQEEESFTRKLCLNLRKKLVKCCIWSTALYGAEILTFRKVLKCGAGEGWKIG